jgi:hypothetical protein
MIYHQVCKKNNTTGATREAGTAFPSEVHEFAPVSFTLLSMVRVVHDLKLHVLTCLLSCCDVYYDVRFVFTSICSVGC